MSDTAIYEARRVGLSPGLPYRTGHRRKVTAFSRMTLKEINELNDLDFKAYIRHLGMKQDAEPDLPGEVEQLKNSVREQEALILDQEARIKALERMVAGRTSLTQDKIPKGSIDPKGLYVAPR